jgi:hypothetical protein
MNMIKTHTTTNGNELEFYTIDRINEEHIVVHDKSCQLRRTYLIDVDFIELINEEHKELVRSQKQVIDAWIDEKVWF